MAARRQQRSRADDATAAGDYSASSAAAACSVGASFSAVDASLSLAAAPAAPACFVAAGTIDPEWIAAATNSGWIWKGWRCRAHYELRRRSRLSGREQFARLQIITGATWPDEKGPGPPDWRYWIRVGSVGRSLDPHSAWSRALHHFDAVLVNSRHEVRRTNPLRGQLNCRESEDDVKTVCDKWRFFLTGQNWWSSERDQQAAPAFVRHPSHPGKFLTFAAFTAEESAAEERTEVERRKNLAAGRPTTATPSLSRLSSHEWSLIMLALSDSADILCLAATCKQMASDASQVAAWRSTPPRRIALDVIQRSEAEHPSLALKQRMLSYFRSPPAPASVRPSSFLPLHVDASECTAIRLDQLASVETIFPDWMRALVGLRLSFAPWPGQMNAPRGSCWARLIRAPQCSRLQTLEFRLDPPSSPLRVTLPSLRQLTIHGHLVDSHEVLQVRQEAHWRRTTAAIPNLHCITLVGDLTPRHALFAPLMCPLLLAWRSRASSAADPLPPFHIRLVRTIEHVAPDSERYWYRTLTGFELGVEEFTKAYLKQADDADKKAGRRIFTSHDLDAPQLHLQLLFVDDGALREGMRSTLEEYLRDAADKVRFAVPAHRLMKFEARVLPQEAAGAELALWPSKEV